MTSPDPRPEPAPSAADSREPDSEPVLPEQSREDTDLDWGEYQEAGDERLHRDRPPHWDDY